MGTDRGVRGVSTRKVDDLTVSAVEPLR